MVELQANNLQVPQIDTMGAFAQGANAAQGVKVNDSNLLDAKRRRSSEDLQQIASIGLGLMDGNLDGQVDPQKYAELLPWAKAQGLDMSAITPEMIPEITRSSLTTLQQIQAAQSEQEIDLRTQELQSRLAQLAKGGDAPASVQEWEYFNKLPPEEQSKYLIMKRSNPYLNQGTQFAAPDPANPGTTLGPAIPINNQQEAYDKGFGSEAGQAAAARIQSLPGAIAKADNMLATIDGILNDPALDASTGWLSFLQGVPGTDQYRFGQRALQLQGQAFLQAFESLKGGGAITQIEGEKAAQAIGRLSTSQSAEDYRAALDELKGIINAAKTRTVENATSSASGQQGATTAPAGNDEVTDWTEVF